MENATAIYTGSHIPKRAEKYPSIKNQLDMLFHDIDEGLLGEAVKQGAFYISIKQVKDANPKGE